MTTTETNVIPLNRTVVEDEHDSDEVAAVGTMVEDEVLLDEHATVNVPHAVDPPAKQMTMEDLVGRWDVRHGRVLLPPWLKSLKTLKRTAWWVCRMVGFEITFHGLKLPKYSWRAFVRFWVGAARAVGAYWGWLWDREGRQMARLAHQGADQGAWKAARKEWAETVRKRWIGSLVCLVVGGGLIGVAYALAPAQYTALVIVGVIGFLVWLGAPEDTPLIDVPMDTGARVLRLTSGMILKALNGLGIPAIDRVLKEDPKGIRFYEAPHRAEGGQGFQATVELPGGVTAAEVGEKREKLASGLRRPLGCVWPEGAIGAHPGRMELFVADEDMNTAAQPPWPLRRSGTVDIFKAQPFGTDPRGRIVKTTLMYASGVIGAVPRVGKTFTLRELLLFGALDPRVKVYAFDKKGSGDLSALEHVAHAYTVGDDDDDIEVDIQYLRDLQKEMKRRYKVLRGLPKDRAPETKVTPELCADRSLGFDPVLMGVDECQRWFEHEKYGSTPQKPGEFEMLCTDLVKRGPAAGIMCFFATQKPDAKSIPSGISGNAVWRFCLKVMDHIGNDQVLGTGAHKAGIRATVFSFDDLGIGYLVSEGSRPRIVKTFYLDARAAEKVAIRGRELREKSGRLTGYAAGEQDSPETSRSLLDDLPVVFRQNEKLHSDTIIELLQDVRPGMYDGWTTTTFALALRDQLSIATKQMRVGSEVKAGLTREAVLDAVGAALEGRQSPVRAVPDPSDAPA